MEPVKPVMTQFAELLGPKATGEFLRRTPPDLMVSTRAYLEILSELGYVLEMVEPDYDRLILVLVRLRFKMTSPTLGDGDFIYEVPIFEY